MSYDAERIASLLHALPPAPGAWVLAAQDLPALSVRELLEETAAASVTPGAGAAAAVTIGLAAALAAMAARLSQESWDAADAAAAQAETIRSRVEPLAAEGVAAYSEVLRLRRE